ncbi:tripartite tricarboxylate transporter TctB family protein [Phytopseudomonas dryadis]|uniref:Tripartite tricarboxylate transporter TctB family protein n=1 Tax=Phytopseudomonas dryadis TaxID=2487520 RepID=A0A4Q9R5I7_9GAMM|nr:MULTISPECIES: tripartite tricarboxylate transporter TctB family protein [Pseudomonas]TBU95613.1 tripartite tricarboxylate transporter TctB family protein [Pseudomonas dryadis]TBV01368.1 tripartite tricarboxylate transporter TctB family protein [Pseudomonas dryadis]TBV14123.1 tripartite tricarboxylate transporter TctB family protein [Pseudomonas sp. FRB 230]
MSQRIFGLVLLCACVGLSIVAWGYHAPFSYEPVGPRAYPLLLLILLGLGAIYLLVKPASASTAHADEPPLDRHILRKVVGCVVIFTLYAALFEPLGFVPASLIFGIAMVRLYDGTWAASVISGLVMAVGLYLLFDKALDVPLPLGILSALEI